MKENEKRRTFGGKSNNSTRRPRPNTRPNTRPQKPVKSAPVVQIPKVNPARLAAFRSLGKMKYGKYTNIEINTTLVRSDMSDADRRLYTALVYGVTERLITLDYCVSVHSSRPVAQIDNGALCALRLGIYQLAFMDKIPDHAAVSESVELAGGAGGFVNAVLRSFIRAGKTVPVPENAGDIRRMSVKFSVPEDLCRDFCGWYGRETAEKIFEAFYTREKVSLRLNTLKITAEEAISRLSAEKSKIAADTVCVESLGKDEREGINEGLWFVQDEASAFAAKVLAPLPGETVVDCCAAPGGKSFSSALQMENSGTVYSFDLHENKLSLISGGAKKLGVTIIKTERRDAREAKPELVRGADRVLCDAPCSGLGVIGKKPDIKYKGAASVERLPEIQLAVLSGASEYVREGGVLVYSTCTLNPAENGGITGKFLSENPDFELFPFEAPDRSQAGEITLLPYEYGTDGFYICRMRRKKAQA